MRARLWVLVLAIGTAARADVTPPPTSAKAAPRATRHRTRWPAACQGVLLTWVRSEESDFRWLGRDGRPIAVGEGELGLHPRDVPAGAGEEAAARRWEIELLGDGVVDVGARCRTADEEVDVEWACTRAGCQTSLHREPTGAAAPVGGQLSGPFVWLPAASVDAVRITGSLHPALLAEAHAVAVAAGLPAAWPEETPDAFEGLIGKRDLEVTFRAGHGRVRHEARCELRGASPSCVVSRTVDGTRVATYRAEARVVAGGRQLEQSLVTPDGAWRRTLAWGPDGRAWPVHVTIEGGLVPLRD